MDLLVFFLIIYNTNEHRADSDGTVVIEMRDLLFMGNILYYKQVLGSVMREVIPLPS